VLLFFIAALIEGLFRQLVQDVDTRTFVLTLTALMWLAYFGLVGRKRGTLPLDEAEHVFGAQGEQAATATPRPARGAT
jgi:hypothetical protein